MGIETKIAKEIPENIGIGGCSWKKHGDFSRRKAKDTYFVCELILVNDY